MDMLVSGRVKPFSTANLNHPSAPQIISQDKINHIGKENLKSNRVMVAKHIDPTTILLGKSSTSRFSPPSPKLTIGEVPR